jgi:hypothetical protein
LKVQKTASLHEDSVQAVARGDVEPYRERRRAKPGFRTETTRDDRVNPTLLAEAKRIAKRTGCKVRIVNKTQVLIVNK